MVKSGSANERIYTCRNRNGAMVKDMVKIKVIIKVRSSVKDE